MDDIILPFDERLLQENTWLRCLSLDTVQINVGRLCNQACIHCHVEAGPNRTEIMDRRMAELAMDFVEVSGAGTVDITGGAPELHPSFRDLVLGFRSSDRHVIDRSNLTVLLEPGMEDLPEFLAENKVEIVASLPCYTEENVDKQRGHGVYQKSVAALRRLNALGYGQPGSSLVLNLVYNPLAPELPGPQEALEADYRRELNARFGLFFNHLYIITNMHIGRFGQMLSRNGEIEDYSRLLARSFNPATLQNLMCLRQVSVAWDGYLYDCDFNQMLDLRLRNGRPFRLGEMPAAEITNRLKGRLILTGSHCYGCTAGIGSSCAGALV